MADANVTRPTLYRRWKNKLELVADALDYGFRKQDDMYTVDPSQPSRVTGHSLAIAGAASRSSADTTE